MTTIVPKGSYIPSGDSVLDCPVVGQKVQIETNVRREAQFEKEYFGHWWFHYIEVTKIEPVY